MTQEETDLLGKIKTQTEEMVKSKGYTSKGEVEELVKLQMKTFEGLDVESLKSLTNADKGVMKILQAQGAEITALKEKGAGNQAEEPMIKQIENWTVKHKDTLNKIKDRVRVDIPEFDVKVATMTTANVVTQGSPYLPQPGFDNTLHDLRRVQPTFWDYLPKGRTSNSAWVWVNKKQPTGAAAFIGQGVAKPGIAFELTTEISNAKKIAVSAKSSTEILQDIQGMESWIKGEMSYQFKKVLNSKFLTGAATTTDPAGITTLAVPFSTTGLETDNPNNFDAILAAITQLRVNFFDGPVTVFVNPVDYANMIMTKADTSGVYILPPFAAANGMNIGGAIVVADNNIASGYLLAAQLDLYKVLIYKDASIQMGWENDDFTKNLVTWIMEMRVHQYMSDNDRGAFIYDTFAHVKAFLVAS
jgi:HK97 family phage major capsid protein